MTVSTPKNAAIKKRTDTKENTRRSMPSKSIPPQSALGRFSFGPTTQTTVVTTTTTTTTKFPALLMSAPKYANSLDSRYYPLAASPTPSCLKNITFSLDGRSVSFREASDTRAEIEQIEEESSLLKRNNGSIRKVRNSGVAPFVEEEDLENVPGSLSTLSDRPASPESIAAADSHLEFLGDSNAQSEIFPRNKKQRRTQSNTNTRSKLRTVQNPKPATPDMNRQRSTRPYPLALSIENKNSHIILPSPAIHNQHAGRTDTPRGSQQEQYNTFVANQDDTLSRTVSRASYDSAVPTPPIEPEDALISERRLSAKALSSIPTRLHVSQSPSLQDGILPSPSLSPVTTTTSTHHNEYFADVDSNSEHGSQPGQPLESWRARRFERTPSHSRYESPAITETALSDDEDYSDSGEDSTPSFQDIPAVLEFFEALPDGMKSYVMHQLLRRCPKSTLHLVADAVNPVLKCDFLTLLPAELGLNILRYLDVKSLCRASQVSKKWRQMINSDERAWKELFEADGYILPEGELQQAIAQGWGWQDPSGPDGREVDLNRAPSMRTDSEAGSPSPFIIQKPSVAFSLRRSKRKAATQLTNRSKMAKRQALSRETSIDLESIDWHAQMSTAEGPYNAANAAALAVPNPEVSIPSLKGLHLYKSLYRRHHLIKRNWMSEETKPHHLAFRAHGSHVVTCLQFDTDKILTGSDDNNINVYDTKTGKQKRILQGHEGGVWALQYIGNTLVSGSTDRSVRVWNVETGEQTHVFRGHTSTVRCLQILRPTKVGETADGKDILMPKQPLVITGSRDSTLRIWKLPKQTDPRSIQTEADEEADDSPYHVRTLSGHGHSVRAIAAHADTLVSGSYDCSVRVWKISTGETVHRLQGHAQKVYSVVLDHERNRCISGSMDYLVKIWSLETGSALYTLEGHSSLVGLLDLNCDRLVSAAADSTLRIWDPENGQCKSTLTAHTGAITCFQHDSQKVVSGSDRTLKMWDIKTGYCKKDLLSDLTGVWQVKFNERRCVAAVQRDNVTFIEVLDFGAARDGVPERDRGRRVVVDEHGQPVDLEEDVVAEV